MSRWEIQTNPDLCTGCMRCMLVCSWQYEKQFALAAARIQVSVADAEIIVSFLDDCVQCGLCADNCFYGALIKKEITEEAS